MKDRKEQAKSIAVSVEFEGLPKTCYGVFPDSDKGKKAASELQNKLKGQAVMLRPEQKTPKIKVGDIPEGEEVFFWDKRIGKAENGRVIFPDKNKH